MYISSYGIVNELSRLLLRLNHHTVCIFEIDKMILAAKVGSCKVNRLMTVRLTAL